MRHPVLAALCLTSACGPAPTPAPGLELVRPTAVAEIELLRAERSLPPELAEGPLALAALPGVGALIGGPAGLFEVGTEGLTMIDDRSVTAIVHYGPAGLVIAQGTEVSLWSGALVASQLAESLESANISALWAQGDTLWIGTSLGLHRFEAGALAHYQAMPAPIGIWAFLGGRDVLVTDTDGGTEVIRELGGHQERQVLGDSVDALVPGAGDRLYGLVDGALTERIALSEERATFTPVAFDVLAEVGATDVSALTVDASTGFVWALGDRLARLEDGRVSTLPAPELEALRLFTATVDGALWLADSNKLVRIGNDGPPVTWGAEISAFYRDNCQRCHVTLGVAQDLGSYEAWSSQVDQIVAEVESGRMPQDGRALVGGSVELVRRWRADGLRR